MFLRKAKYKHYHIFKSKVFHNLKRRVVIVKTGDKSKSVSNGSLQGLK